MISKIIHLNYFYDYFIQKVHYHSKVWSQGAIKMNQNEQSKDMSLTIAT